MNTTLYLCLHHIKEQLCLNLYNCYHQTIMMHKQPIVFEFSFSIIIVNKMIKLFTDLVILRYFFNLVVYVFLFIAINIYFVRKKKNNNIGMYSLSCHVTYLCVYISCVIQIMYILQILIKVCSVLLCCLFS